MSKKVKGYFGSRSGKQYNIPNELREWLKNGCSPTIPQNIRLALNEVWEQAARDVDEELQVIFELSPRTDSPQTMPELDCLEQVTITTGRANRTARSEVADDTIERVKEILNSARPYVGDIPLKRAFVSDIPGDPGFSLVFTPGHESLAATVCWNDIPAVTFMVAGDASESTELWRMLLAPAGFPIHVNMDNPPQVPWCGVRPELTFFLTPPTSIRWIADFARWVAWAWLEPDGDRYPQLSVMKNQGCHVADHMEENDSFRSDGSHENVRAPEGQVQAQGRAQSVLNRYFNGTEHMRIPYPQPLPEELAPWHCYTRDGGHAILCVPMDSYYDTQYRNEDCVVPISVKAVLRRGYRMLDGFVVVDVPCGPWGVVQDEDDCEYSDFVDASGF